VGLGFVSLVGAGPGDPDLLTLAGQQRLAEAEVVIYDRLVGQPILRHCRPETEMVFAGKSPAGHTLTQDEINDLLVQKSRAGKRVVRLKGGDPFVFGRGGEEALALAAAGVPFEVIPGVTSAIAAPAYAGVPVTHRGLASSFAVITGHEDDTKEEASVDWPKLATAVDTLVVLMGAAALDVISKALIAGGRSPDTPAVSIQWGSTPDQRSVAAPLRRIADAVRDEGLGTPLLTVIGEVASLRDHISWFESRPLFGKRVLVTRTREQASRISDLLRREGAIPVELPAIDIVLVVQEEVLEACLSRLSSRLYNWCVFTSQNAVDYFHSYVWGSGSDARLFSGCRLGAIGSATAAALERIGLRADLLGRTASSEGLLEAMKEQELAGTRILFPRAEGGQTVLVDGLRALGAEVDEFVMYQSLPPPSVDETALKLIRAGDIDVATFASSSSVANLATLLGADFERLKRSVVACIGPVTAETARKHGLEVAVEPAEQTIDALVRALRDHYDRA
jgi:uroporphyrinogen III methyltransferase / synthase